MNEILATLRLIAELTQGIERAANIIGSEKRDLTTEEVNALKARVDSSTSDWLSELERLRGQ